MKSVIPVRTYLLVEIALLGLLGLTILAAQVDLGVWSGVISLSIAALKALLVILFFMHVRHSNKITWVYVLVGFFWLVFLFALTFGDYLTRRWFP